MFENLSDRLERSFKLLKGQGRISEINVAETLKEVRRALIDADVNYKVAKTFTDQVKQKALGRNVINAIKPGELMVKIVHDELAELMGGDAVPLSRWSSIIPSGFHVPRRTQVLPRLSPRFRIRECHPLRCAFPCASPIMSSRLCRQPYNPIFAMVWAPPLSLAATHGIVLTFFSCRY